MSQIEPKITSETVAASYEDLARLLREAEQHCDVAARHHRAGDVPNGCDHAWAIHGYLRIAQELLDGLSKVHASQSSAS